MLRIIQTIHTFLVEAGDLRTAQEMIADSITIDPVNGVTIAQRQIKAGDPFEFQSAGDRDLMDHQQARLAAPRARA